MEEIFRRGWDNLIGRSDGPMSFRIILQPAVAIVLAIRAGLNDAHERRQPFLWNIFANPGHRHELLRHGWKEVRTVFIVALILDSVYQVIVHAGIYILELLITATVLAVVPYCLVRGPVTRIARRQPPATKPTETGGIGRNDESTEKAGALPDGSRDVVVGRTPTAIGPTENDNV